MEEWKDVVGYEGLYKVSNLGRIKSLKKQALRTYPERIMKQEIIWSGYSRIQLSKNNKSKKHLVHRLVVEAFIGPIPNNMEVNHIDEIKTNNKVVNLEILTKSENCLHGKRSEKISSITKNGPLSKELIQMDMVGNEIQRWPSLKEAERKGFHAGNISMCCSGKYKYSQGYKWKYAL